MEPGGRPPLPSRSGPPGRRAGRACCRPGCQLAELLPDGGGDKGGGQKNRRFINFGRDDLSRL